MYLEPEEEPTKKELEKIERMLEREEYFDEDFDALEILEEDFNLDDDYYGEDY